MELVNGIYPSGYWFLHGTAGTHAPSELWWSSRERKTIDGVSGALTSEYLELDFGRARSFNFVSFAVLQKPFDITIEYDAWSFETGAHNWQEVTRLEGELFDSRISFAANSVNPWKTCQFYITNSLGLMIHSRYLRLGFHRRNEVWPNSTLAGSFPWSIDVRGLRTARYLTSINDARGVLVNQSTVAVALHDVSRYTDGDTAIMVFDGGNEPGYHDDDIVTLGSAVSGLEDAIILTPRAGDGETYWAFMSSNDSCGIVAASDGTGGMTAAVNVNGQLTDTNNAGGSHSVTTTTIVGAEFTDTNEAGHFATDHPGFAVDWAFFFPHPAPAASFCWMLAMGDGDSSGVGTTTRLDDNRNRNAASSAVDSTNNFGSPPAGTLMTYAIIVGNSESVADASLLLADGWTLSFSDFSGLSHGFSFYFYTKLATGGEGNNYVYPTVTLSAVTKWTSHFAYLGTPSAPSAPIYLMASGEPIEDPTPAGLTNGLRFTAGTHGGSTVITPDHHDSARAKLVAVVTANDIHENLDDGTGLLVGVPSDPGDIYSAGGGGIPGDNENYVAFAWHASGLTFHDPPNWVTFGLYTGATSGGGAAVNFTQQREIYEIPGNNFAAVRVHAYQDASAGHLVTDLPYLEMQYSDGDVDTRVVILRAGDGTNGPKAIGTTTTQANQTFVSGLGGVGNDGISIDVSAIASTDLCFFWVYNDVSSTPIVVPTSGLTLVADIADPEVSGGQVAIYAGLRGAHTVFEAYTDNTLGDWMGIVTSIDPTGWTSNRWGILFNDLATYSGTGDRGTSLTHPEV